MSLLEGTKCPICLSKITHPAMTNSCSHVFCHSCIREWSKVTPFCPHCRVHFDGILFNIRSTEDYEEELTEQAQKAKQFPKKDRFVLTKIQERRLRIYIENLNIVPERKSLIYSTLYPLNKNNVSKFPEIWQAKLESFIKRELQMLLSERMVENEYNLVMKTLRRYDATSEEAVLEFSGIVPPMFAKLFAREISSFGNSSCNLSEYDSTIRYQAPEVSFELDNPPKVSLSSGNVGKEIDIDCLHTKEHLTIEDYRPQYQTVSTQSEHEMSSHENSDSSDQQTTHEDFVEPRKETKTGLKSRKEAINLREKKQRLNEEISLPFLERIRKQLKEKIKKRVKEKRKSKAKSSSSSSNSPKRKRRKKRHRKSHKEKRMSFEESDLSDWEEVQTVEVAKPSQDETTLQKKEESSEIDRETTPQKKEESSEIDRENVNMIVQFQPSINKLKREREEGNKTVDAILASLSCRKRS